MPASDMWPARDSWIDKRETLCPAPVIALAHASRGASRDDVIVVLADDPAAEFDIPAWCRMTGNTFVSQAPQDFGTAYAVQITSS